VPDSIDNDAPCVSDAGGVSFAASSSEQAVHEGYATAEDARRYASKTRKGLLRRISAARESRLVRRALRGLPAGAVVLDVPCGAGRLLPVISSVGCRAMGADFAAPMLAIARGAGAPVTQASAFRLPFANGSLPAIASVRLLHHYGVEERGAILREFARVASDRVLVTVFDADSYKHRRRTKREARRGRRSLRFGVRVAEFLEEVRTAGLEPGRVRGLLPGYAELTFVTCRVPR
jgi:SAM-dependent methyltransferase